MSEMYDSTRQAWEDIWQQANVDIELQTITYPHAQEVFNHYIQYLDPDGLHLEAGSGLSAALISLRRKDFRVIGLDYAYNALAVSQEYDPSLELMAGDVHKLPYATNSLDGYLSFGVLEHFQHGMGPGLEEAVRVLKSGGILVLTIPYPNVVWRMSQLRKQLMGQSTLIDDDFYESRYTQHDLIRETTAVGFEVVSVIPSGQAFTFWTLGKPFQQTEGYYEPNALARRMGSITKRIAPWAFNFNTVLIGRKK